MEELDQAKDLNGFIELANLVRFVDGNSLDDFRSKLYLTFFKFANRSKILNDQKYSTLKTANELHSKIIDECKTLQYNVRWKINYAYTFERDIIMDVFINTNIIAPFGEPSFIKKYLIDFSNYLEVKSSDEYV